MEICQQDVLSKDPFEGVIGLSRIKQQIRVTLASCRIRRAPFPHSLLSGLGGTGKSLLSKRIAKYLNVPFFETEAAELKSRNDALNWILACNQQSGGSFVLFVDEIHRLSIDRQEAFYIPMIDGIVNRNNGNGIEKTRLNPFTLIGATTRRDMLDQGSFVTRFQNVWDIGRYSQLDMELVIGRAALKQGLVCEASERMSIAQRCLGIPRVGVNMVEKVRDQVLYSHYGDNRVRRSDVMDVFNLAEIDCIGLSRSHITYLRALARNPSQAKGLGVLSSLVGMNKTTVEDVLEPILLSLGLVYSTPKGRMLTQQGLDHLVKQGFTGGKI